MSLPVQVKPNEAINGDRRSNRRYDLALVLRWKLVRRRRVLDSGTGFTVDLSSGGLRFDAGRQLPVGLNVELTIEWPALLHNIAPMCLAVSGRIIRANGGQIAIHMLQHEFRPTGVPSERQTPLAASQVASVELYSEQVEEFETVQ